MVALALVLVPLTGLGAPLPLPPLPPCFRPVFPLAVAPGGDEFGVLGVGHRVAGDVKGIQPHLMHRPFVAVLGAAHDEGASRDQDHSPGRPAVQGGDGFGASHLAQGGHGLLLACGGQVQHLADRTLCEISLHHRRQFLHQPLQRPRLVGPGLPIGYLAAHCQCRVEEELQFFRA